MKTGIVNSLSTAALEALMEEAACKALEAACLSEEQTSIGARVSIIHRRPTAIGATVTAVARVEDINRNGIQFAIEAFDEAGLVGTATHTRVIVPKYEFETRCYDTSRKATELK